MLISHELPEKCRECARSATLVVHDTCNFCRDLEFHEEVLCQLNRSIQNPKNFECYAFQPILELISPSVKRVPDVSCRLPLNPWKKTFRKLFLSDKIKYERALALQKLARDPDDIFVELKYHFVWNVIQRRPVFTFDNDIFDLAHDIFLECGEIVGGFVSLLWLASDHVHLYVASDGENSAGTMSKEIKLFSSDAILNEFPDIKAKLAAENEIWDEAYFVETIS